MPECCPICGGNYALIGRAHNCKPLPVANPAANKSGEMANHGGGSANTTYRHRDREKRREYMRNLMAKKRAAARSAPVEKIEGE